MSEEKPIVLFRDVTSNNIKKLGHKKDTLFVVFHNESCYEYFPVSIQDYEKLLGAQSIGAHFHNKIVKNKSIKHKSSKAYEPS